MANSSLSCTYSFVIIGPDKKTRLDRPPLNHSLATLPGIRARGFASIRCCAKLRQNLSPTNATSPQFPAVFSLLTPLRELASRLHLFSPTPLKNSSSRASLRPADRVSKRSLLLLGGRDRVSLFDVLFLPPTRSPSFLEEFNVCHPYRSNRTSPWRCRHRPLRRQHASRRYSQNRLQRLARLGRLGSRRPKRVV